MAEVTSIMREDTPVAVAYETFNVVLGGGDTTALITPTTIKAIDHVEVTPTNSAAAGADAYLTSFSPGAASVTITSANSASCLVTVFGRIG